MAPGPSFDVKTGASFAPRQWRHSSAFAPSDSHGKLRVRPAEPTGSVAIAGEANEMRTLSLLYCTILRPRGRPGAASMPRCRGRAKLKPGGPHIGFDRRPRSADWTELGKARCASKNSPESPERGRPRRTATPAPSRQVSLDEPPRHNTGAQRRSVVVQCHVVVPSRPTPIVLYY
jgi:hypothetical protein